MKLTIPVSKKDHAKGKENAPVTLVEYGDFECPDCQEAYSIINELQKIEGNKLKFVFRNFPLSEIHPHAFRAASAAEAAGKQGKFWEMHDLIFENQERLDNQDLLSYAKNLKLDIAQFNKDIESEEIIKKVKNDFMSGVRSGVNGTPTFYINGARFDESYELDLLLRAIKETLWAREVIKE
ncbi:MAG: disulfide bond formation protein DsbA [Candidatus Levybacteria bacterium RIFCSPLOWO2_01_FULL_39_24]|nr:MAG: disulfide bond formation protein DsbA [Candidatus Levybacteria bacterium RIFCSPHIGHO2_01_FULL_40_16]OGH28270.1 MAG: disulfide bond formation protein DsbA [Candidatus Levybacteria bacterium RIFCSPHIGHO2_12_FULL_39_9]OGH46497.1 MAG: disulfide bond formation protein DsbA [Candidatus Levybacteria bacterium RIFCSPLOWO2_01_FULL_39_24]